MIALLLAATLQAFPYPNGSQGYADPAQDAQTLCAPTFRAGAIRPSSAYARRLKKEQMAALHLPGAPSDYEEDHIISLELGGSPTDPRNLSPQAYAPKPGAHEKDRVEDRLRHCLCLGRMDLPTAQKLVSQQWVAAYSEIQRGTECPGLE